MQAFRAAGGGTTQKPEVLEPTVHTWHPRHLLQGTRAGVVVLPMALIQETGKGESPVQALQGTRGPYPVRPSVQSSPASLRGTRASESHQGAPTPPGRRTPPRPQRSHGPVRRGTRVHSGLCNQKHSPQPPQASWHQHCDLRVWNLTWSTCCPPAQECLHTWTLPPPDLQMCV